MLTEQPPCEHINGVPLDWSGRGTSHVDYDKSEVLPLIQGRFLGHGMHGGVYETNCNNVRLAWKRKYCRRKIGERERREIEIIKKLSHRHVIRLVGTYTHGSFLGLLLWPVAVCDLATLIEDVDWLQKRVLVERGLPVELPEDWMDHVDDRQARLEALGVAFYDSMSWIRNSAVAVLKRTIGCIASAVAYLHMSNIKHKDLKPSNILLSRDGLWLADFGTATDFSVLTSSVTDDGERGTLKYFAPEVANFEPNGRAADIFSIGCIFLEIITLCCGHTLELTYNLRDSNDRSYQSSIANVIAWFHTGDWPLYTVPDSQFLDMIRWMMEEQAIRRPTAQMVEERIALISGFAQTGVRASGRVVGFYRTCCNPDSVAHDVTAPQIIPDSQFTVHVTMGSASRLSKISDGTRYSFYISLSDESYIQEVMFFVSVLNRAFPPRQLLTYHA